MLCHLNPSEVKWKSLSRVWLFATPWTTACQAPLSMEFSRQEYKPKWCPSKWGELSLTRMLCSVMASSIAQPLRIYLQCRKHRRRGFDPWVRKIPWRRKWQPTPEFLSGKSREQRSLAGYSPCGHKESDTTEWRSMQGVTHSRNTPPLSSTLWVTKLHHRHIIFILQTPLYMLFCLLINKHLHILLEFTPIVQRPLESPFWADRWSLPCSCTIFSAYLIALISSIWLFILVSPP